MPVRNFQYFMMTVPNLEVGRRFYADFGLDTKERSGRIICSCYGRNQDQVVLVEGEHKRLHHLCFGAAEADMKGISDALNQSGDAEQVDSPKEAESGDGIWLRDFDGMLTNIRVANETPSGDGLTPTFNLPNHINRLGRRSELVENVSIHPRRLGHVVAFTSDPVRKVKLYNEVFGLRVSDYIADFLFFLYTPTGSDHHIVGFAKSKNYGLQHAGFEVGSTDEVAIGGGQMIMKGYTPAWGPGRHAPGSNVFFYTRDPWKGIVEYYTDMDYIPAGASWEAIDWFPRRDSSTIWGTPQPSDFPTNFEVVGNMSKG